MRPSVALRRGREIAIVGDERSAVAGERLLHHRMAAALDHEIERAVDLRPHVVALDRELSQGGGDVEHRQRLGRRLDRRRLPPSPFAASRSKVSSSMPSARSAALAILASSSPSSVVVKRTCPASVWRWMKVALSGARHQLVAVLRRHLDEIAEHVVVPDLQRAHGRWCRHSAPAAPRSRGGIRRATRAPRRARRRSLRARSRRRA